MWFTYGSKVVEFKENIYIFVWSHKYMLVMNEGGNQIFNGLVSHNIRVRNVESGKEFIWILGTNGSEGAAARFDPVSGTIKPPGRVYRRGPGVIPWNPRTYFSGGQGNGP